MIVSERIDERTSLPRLSQALYCTGARKSRKRTLFAPIFRDTHVQLREAIWTSVKAQPTAGMKVKSRRLLPSAQWASGGT